MWPAVLLFAGGLIGVALTYILTKRKELIPTLGATKEVTN
jgi:hypothetical protein